MRWKLAVDVLMTMLVPTLMAYMLVGEFAHEILGSAMTLLVAAHLWLNRRWFRALSHGCYTPKRAIQTLIICLAALCMVATVVTGIATSRYVFTGLPVFIESSTAELVHMTCAHWGLVFVGLHAGIGAGRYVRPLFKRHPHAKWPLRLCALLVSLWGASAIVRRGVWRYLLLLNHFAFMDPSDAALPFVLDYLAAMALFGVIGALLFRARRRASEPGANTEPA